MNNQRQRRKWTAQAKLKLVLETLASDHKLAQICRREGVSPNQVYEWRRRLLGAAEAIFARKDRAGPDPQIEKLATENTRMKNVIAQITAENLELKKTLSD
jgi:transposase